MLRHWNRSGRTHWSSFFVFPHVIEGIKERDKKLIMPILMAVALMKDQAYHLARHIWNDVQDDWPFYTSEEKSILKRWVFWAILHIIRHVYQSEQSESGLSGGGGVLLDSPRASSLPLYRVSRE